MARPDPQSHSRSANGRQTRSVRVQGLTASKLRRSGNDLRPIIDLRLNLGIRARVVSLFIRMHTGGLGRSCAEPGHRKAMLERMQIA